MKKIMFILLLCLQTLNCAAADSNGYIVKLKDKNNIALFAATSENISKDNLTPLINDLGLYSVTTQKMCDELIESGLAEYAEPDRIVTLYDNIGMPNDPYYPSNQLNIFAINAIAAWNLGIYGNDVKIGYVDSGIYPHYDLKNAIAGGSHYYTVKNDSGNEIVTSDDDYNDTFGHGTFGAGIIAAEANNFGGIGVAPRTKLYAMKCFEGKNANMSVILKAIKDSVDLFNCKVINMSFGVNAYDSSLKNVIDYVSSKGAILIAASGNDNRNSSSYPGAFSNVVSVGSVDLNGKKNSFSNYGSGVNLVTIGSSLTGCAISGEKSYDTEGEGTSYAAPCVTAAAALCLNIDPDMTQNEFFDILNATCTPLTDTSYYLGAGMLNIENIMNYMMKGKSSYYSPVSTYNDTVFQIITNFGDTPLSFADIWKTDCGYSLKNTSVQPNTSYKSSFTINSSDSEIKHFVWNSIESLMPIYKYTK